MKRLEYEAQALGSERIDIEAGEGCVSEVHLSNRGPVEVTVKRQVSNGTVLLTEWTSSYTQGGRRWSGTPGASVIEVGRHGITYQRDYQ